MYVMKKTFLLLLVSSLLCSPFIRAGYECTPDTQSTITPPPKRCVENASSPLTLKECLNGKDPLPCPPGSVGCTKGSLWHFPPCTPDSRYNLRNFAPFLLFPNIGSMLGLAINLITFIAGLVAGAYMFYGAYQYVGSGGDPKRMESARNNIIYALIGLVIVILSYAIVRTILSVTGTNTIGF